MCFMMFKGSFTLASFAAILAASFAAILVAIFATISSAISNRPCKLLAIHKFQPEILVTPNSASMNRGGYLE